MDRKEARHCSKPLMHADGFPVQPDHSARVSNSKKSIFEAAAACTQVCRAKIRNRFPLKLAGPTRNLDPSKAVVFVSISWLAPCIQKLLEKRDEGFSVCLCASHFGSEEQ